MFERARAWPGRHSPTRPSEMPPRSVGRLGRPAMAQNASHHEQRNDRDDLTAENDAVDIHRRSKAHVVSVDDVDASRLGLKREDATGTGPSADALRSGTLTAAAAASPSHDRHRDDCHAVALVRLANNRVTVRLFRVCCISSATSTRQLLSIRTTVRSFDQRSTQRSSGSDRRKVRRPACLRAELRVTRSSPRSIDTRQRDRARRAATATLVADVIRSRRQWRSIRCAPAPPIEARRRLRVRRRTTGRGPTNGLS
jgi:hypothetical protein